MKFFTFLKSKNCILTILVTFFFFSAKAQRIASVSGPWSSTITWGGAAVPTAGQTVVINDGITVTVDVAAVCASLTVNGGSNASTVTINGANSLAIGGALTINSGNGNGDHKTVAVGAGTLSCTSVSMATTGNDNRANRLTISTGTATVSGNIIMDDGDVDRNQVIITGAGRLNVSGALFTGGSLTTATGSTVDYYGAAQTIRTETYSNLTLSGSNTKSVPANCTATGNLTIGFGVTFRPTADLTFTLGGNLANAGSLDADNGTFQMDITLNGSSNQTISGAGILTEFNNITINNTGAANNNIVEFLSTNITVIPAGFLTLTQGIIKMSGTYTLTNTFFNTANYTIPAAGGIWLNNPNVTLTAQSNNINVRGSLRVTNGTYNVGTSNAHKLLYYTGSSITIEGGTLNVSAALGGSGTTDLITYNQSGGTVTVATSGNSQNWGSFEIFATGSTFIMSGGSIVLQQLSTVYADYWNNATNFTVTGGTIQVGNTLTPTTAPINFWILTTPSIYNLTVSSTNSPTAEIRANTTVLNDVTISTSAGLNASTLNNNLTVGRHFINNGTFTQQAATVTFNGSVLQNIGGTNNTTFYNLTANNTAGAATSGISLQRPAFVTNILTLTNGHITTSSTNLLTLNSAASASYTTGSTTSFINGPMAKIGTTAFTFPVGKLNAGMREIGISAPSPSTTFQAEFNRAPSPNRGSVLSPITQVSACEYWTLDRTGSANVAVTLFWNSNSPCNGALYVTNLSDLQVARYNGSQWTSEGNSGTTGTNINGTITSGTVSTFSSFSLASNNSATNPLPVKLVNVKAYKSGSRNIIEWTNLTESDVINYELEKSIDGTRFETMSSFAPKTNANSREDYVEYDLHPSPVTYYRIKVISLGSRNVYSPVVKVAAIGTLQQDIVLYPNPVTGKQFTLQMNSAAGNYTVRVYGANGQVIKTETLKHPGGSFSKTIELPGQLQSGQYYLQVTGGEQILTSKFIIQ